MPGRIAPIMIIVWLTRPILNPVQGH
jgi:hypothetical protein